MTTKEVFPASYHKGWSIEILDDLMHVMDPDGNGIDGFVFNADHGIDAALKQLNDWADEGIPIDMKAACDNLDPNPAGFGSANWRNTPINCNPSQPERTKR
jgi:hypothetical protein